MKIKIILITLLLATQLQAQTKVWFDTDIMIGMPDKEAREVDDGITLIMALKQPQIEIVGISNITYVDYGFGVINKILNWHNKGNAIPVYKGSAFANDLGTENDATKALYQALKKEKLTILALGPMTNIATLIKNHPDIIPQIEKIAICAARTPGLPFNPGNGKLNVFDYNYEFDTASMEILLNSTIPLEFAGYEPSSYTHIGNIDLASLDLTNEADKWLFDVVQPWMELNEKYFGVRGFIPFDCSTLGLVTHPEYFTYYENIPIKVTYKKNDALAIQPDKPYKNFLEVSYKFKTKKKVKYAIRALQGFEEKILETLSAKN
ncbi:pyrimidine-specific ribonucleoside hydrolase [Flavobacterium micromati]|uniref:Pyrimidine-specific ribonucleoside hydrolase n=1 Tax=Flavobacterium micromati TaxID=229205 RepID=A0A1M5ISK7_9FLAO|nr:nucleoside hydrolase [Flavobacterium micromati]SHG31304.1 pyrimidine-specific ribonucleoside hydrolase [Flavobacterium micromati]